MGMPLEKLITSLEDYIEMSKPAPKMTVAEVRALAMEYYQRGGDVVWECWDDLDIQQCIDDGYTKEEWINLFTFYLSSKIEVEGTIWQKIFGQTSSKSAAEK